jgi:hypothetical protein
MRRKPRNQQWRTTENMRAKRKSNSLSHIMDTMSEDNLHGKVGERRRFRLRPNSASPSSRNSSHTSQSLSGSSPSQTNIGQKFSNTSADAEEEHAYNSDPMFREGETVSLNRQRLRIAELLKLCRNQTSLAPNFQPISGLQQKQFHNRNAKLDALRKIRNGDRPGTSPVALPPKYQPTRSIIQALEETEEELPQTVSAALVSFDAKFRHLHELLGETTKPSSAHSSNIKSDSLNIEEPSVQSPNNSARAEVNRQGITSMTNGILQNSYLVERFLKELELVGQFEASKNTTSNHTISYADIIDHDPTVVSALRQEIQRLGSELAETYRSQSILQMENNRLQSELKKHSGIRGTLRRHASTVDRSSIRDDCISSQKQKTKLKLKSRRSSVSIDAGDSRDVLLSLNKSSSTASMKVAEKHNSSTSGPSIKNISTEEKLTLENGKLAFEVEEKKREMSRKIKSRDIQIERLKTLLAAADVEYKNVEDELKRKEKQLGFASDADLDSLVKSLQEQLNQEKNKFRAAVSLLENERAHRSVGSVKMMSTQTVSKTRNIECQTDLSGPVSEQQEQEQNQQEDGNFDIDQINENEDNGIPGIPGTKVATRKKKNKNSKLSGTNWVMNLKHFDAKMPNDFAGILYFAKNYKLGDVQCHTLQRLMLLLQRIMEDKIGGDEHEQEITLQE